MNRVEIDKIDEANLLMLILKSILERNLNKAEIANKALLLNATYHIKAGKMQTALIFSQGRVRLTREFPASISAKIEGDLSAFMDFALKKSRIIPLITRRIKFKGNLKSLLALLPIMEVAS